MQQTFYMFVTEHILSKFVAEIDRHGVSAATREIGAALKQCNSGME
jgi:hypothetical protein